MEALIISIATTVIVTLSFIFGEVLPVILPRISKQFDRKPFNCRPCFTFHLHWLGMAFVAVITQSWIIALLGVLAAFIIFLTVKYIDNKKVAK